MKEALTRLMMHVDVAEDTTAATTIDAIGNDDLTDDATYLAGSLDTTGTSGTVVDNGDGTFGYTPAAGFAGTTRSLTRSVMTTPQPPRVIPPR